MGDNPLLESSVPAGDDPGRAAPDADGLNKQAVLHLHGVVLEGVAGRSHGRSFIVVFFCEKIIKRTLGQEENPA
jgi:hypothetical protein